MYDPILTQPTIFAAASIGKLKILVPWKKLGWEPILISLEDVTIRTGPQDDGEVYCDASFIEIFGALIYLRTLGHVFGLELGPHMSFVVVS